VVPFTEPFQTWIGVGGSPQSVVRAASYGFSLMLAIIGGHPSRFAPFSELYEHALAKFGQDPLPIGIHSPGHVAETDEQAREEFWPHYLDVIGRLGKTRGFSTPTRESYAHEVGPHGALFVGSPETVAEEMGRAMKTLGASRFDLKYGIGGLSHESLMRTIELYGTQVAPRVRELLA
jgi:alkanesulfonate monooxygenase SsuD/methylene tetrahydromethanopterin reductase-like flavin-dependent oxidoreductase (luciferase family)